MGRKSKKKRDVNMTWEGGGGLEICD